MADLTRRGFITTSAGAAAGLATVGVAGGAIAAALGSAGANVAAHAEDTLVAYVRPGSNGEVTVVTGSREVTYRDAGLVRRLQKAVG